MLNIPNRLRELISDRQIVPFIGSGFSIPSGLPSWDSVVKGLINNCASETQKALVSSVDPALGQADVAELLDVLSATDFAAKEYLLEQIGSDRYSPSDYHPLLLEMNWHTIITTNWDLLLERAVQDKHIAHRVVYRDADVSLYDPDRALQIVKLHGTISDPDSLVYRKSHYDSFWKARPLLFNLLGTLMATKSFLFIGYGFGDPNVLMLLEKLREHLGPFRREHYALTFDQGPLLNSFRRQGIVVIDGNKPPNGATKYETATKEFLTDISASSRVVTLSNLERAQLVNSELRRFLKRMPPRPILRMRGALGWLSNPVPIPGDPVYGSEVQDREERTMTELICDYLRSNRHARIQCILNLDAQPLLQSGYQARHLIRRFSTVKEILLQYSDQIAIAHDPTPSYVNQMLFDDQTSLLGFKRSQVLGINRAQLRRARPVVRVETQQFDEDFAEISNNNKISAHNMGIDTGHPRWQLSYLQSLIGEQIDDLEAGTMIEKLVGTQSDFGEDISSFVRGVEFALQKHREYNQKREDGVTPYGVHILRVVERLRQVGLIEDFQILTAAALHDVVEDCEVTLLELRNAYGDRVAGLVGEMTRMQGESRKDYILKFKTASNEAKTIKLADRWDNVMDLNNFKAKVFGNRPASEYLEESKLVLAVCASANQRLATALDKAIRDTVAACKASV